MWLYLMPNLKPITSRSGITEHAAATAIKVGDKVSLGINIESATGTTEWVNTEHIK